MTEDELRAKLKVFEANEKKITEHIEFYFRMKKQYSYFTPEKFLEIIKESYEEAERSKGSVTLDGDL